MSDRLPGYHRYSTGSKLNTNSALIQNFYANEVTPQRAIHVILDPGVEGDEEPGVKAYIRFVM
jgi:translation initiation factor 3 subunit F